MARKDVMLCYPYEDKRFIRWGRKALMQPKLNGDRGRVVIDKDKKVTLFSSSAAEIVSMPHINKAYAESRLVDVEFDGEFYVHGWSHEKIHGVVSRKVNIHPDYKKMEFHVFDIVLPLSQVQRIKTLDAIYHDSQVKHTKLVETAYVDSLDDINKLYKLWIEQGYEGFILRQMTAVYLRKRTNTLLKCKPSKSDAYQIIGYEEEQSIYGEFKGTLGALKLIKDGQSFFVGSGFTRAQRIELWKHRETLPGKWCTIKYQELTTDRQVPKFQSFVNILVPEGVEDDSIFS